MSTEARGIVSEKFMLNLDGVECGYVQSLTIGGITAVELHISLSLCVILCHHCPEKEYF